MPTRDSRKRVSGILIFTLWKHLIRSNVWHDRIVFRTKIVKFESNWNVFKKGRRQDDSRKGRRDRYRSRSRAVPRSRRRSGDPDRTYPIGSIEYASSGSIEKSKRVDSDASAKDIAGVNSMLPEFEFDLTNEPTRGGEDQKKRHENAASKSGKVPSEASSSTEDGEISEPELRQKVVNEDVRLASPDPPRGAYPSLMPLGTDHLDDSSPTSVDSFHPVHQPVSPYQPPATPFVRYNHTSLLIESPASANHFPSTSLLVFFK